MTKSITPSCHLQNGIQAHLRDGGLPGAWARAAADMSQRPPQQPAALAHWALLVYQAPARGSLGGSSEHSTKEAAHSVMGKHMPGVSFGG